MKKLAILMFVGIFLISCAQTEKEISFNTFEEKKGYKTENFTEVLLNGEKTELLKGEAARPLFNKEKTRAVITCFYYENRMQKSDIWYIDSKSNGAVKLFSNMPSSMSSDEDLKYLFVADYTNQWKTGAARIFIYDIFKRKIINETEHHSPDGGYTLKKVVYENGEFKYSLMNDVEHTQTFSLAVK